MRTRTPSAAETTEDFEIWVGLMAWWRKRYQRPAISMRGAYYEADCRDSEIMLYLGTRTLRAWTDPLTRFDMWAELHRLPRRVRVGEPGYRGGNRQ